MDKKRFYYMWMICDKDTAAAREVDGCPDGKVHIVKRVFPKDAVLKCKEASWNIVFASDGMDAKPLTDHYVVTESGELKGHLFDGTVLWYADFVKGGRYENSYQCVKGERVRLGFSRW